MSLVGSVSLTNNQNGLYLGKVAIDNLDISANQILYSANGIDISGLNIGDGLDISSNNLITIGNPAIQLTSNSLYVNDNQTSIFSALSNVSQADTIYISSGSYGESVAITDKYNISLINPSSNNGTICEILNGLNITGTSELIRVSNIQVKGTTSLLNGVGRNYFNNCNFTGVVGSPHSILIGSGTTKFLTFTDCQFNQYCTINISNALTAPAYFINCNFGGATINYGNLSPLLVIMNNCAGLVSFPTNLQATLVGLNVLTTGASRTDTTNINLSQINGENYNPVLVQNQNAGVITYCSSTTNLLTADNAFNYDENTNTLNVDNISQNGTLSFTNPSYISIDGQSSSSLVNYVIAANGVAGLKWSAYAPSLFFNDSYSGQLSAGSGNPYTIFQKVGQANIVPNKPSIMMFSLNITVAGGADVLTLTLQNDDDSSALATLNYNVGNNSQTIAGQFNFTMPNNYTLNYSIIGSLVTHTISTDTNSAYGITLYQNL